jgi:hypothetical protein
VADEASYLSRFTLKFAEIMAAGAATAVSGYLIAHLGGFLSTTAPAPTPAAVEVAPRVVAVPKAETVSPPVQPAAPAAADAGALRATPAHEAAPQAAAPARTTTNAAAAPARKRDTSAAEAKARDKEAAEAKPREKEATESKARDKDDKESVEARVRAALANVDASKPTPAEAPAPPRQAAIPPAPAAATATAQPLPAEAPLTTGTIAATPRAAEASPQPAPQAPAEPNPLVSVEIKSRPVADVPPAAAAPDGTQQASAQEDAKEDKGFLATIKKIPSLLRPASGAATSEPPRPPLPVGEQ